MRFTTAYYLLLIYSLVMLKPLMPFVSDVVSHIFAEAMHIATVHAKYGSNHLEKEVSNTASDNNKNHHNIITEETFSTHVSVNECSYFFRSKNSNKKYPSLRRYHLEAIFLSKQAPPPKFS